MASLIELKTFSDHRGNLTVIEKNIPFDIKRIYYIYGVINSERGHHRHKKTTQAAIAINGRCTVFVKSGDGESPKEFILDSPMKCLILETIDYHWMDDFSSDCILLVLASENFDSNDYIYEKYND